MTYTIAMCEAIAADLDAAGVGTWKADGAYESTDTGILIGLLPPSPDNVIVLTPYPVTDDGTLSDSVIGVQLRFRHGGTDPRDVQSMVDGAFDRLHGRENLSFTGGKIIQILRNSGAPAGQDSNNRWEHMDNYYANVHRPSMNRE